MDLKRAKAAASWLVEQLGPACEQIEVAGSVRRGKDEPGDVELVCIPKPGATKLEFGMTAQQLNPLEWQVQQLVRRKEISLYANGQRMKKFFVSKWMADVDLFIVRPPAQWGVIFTIRTGPAEFAHWLVTRVDKGGGCPNHYHVADGAVWKIGGKGDELVPTPTEESFFAVMGERWIEPARREPRWRKVKVR